MPTPSEAIEALAQRLQAVCLAGGLTVSTAESCTGGMVAHAITSRAGSSGYFLGGVVSYSNDVKVSLLGVADDLLATHGAVSAQVAVAMAAGVRERLATDLAVAVTGVAGPDGGTAEKPVGLVYVAVSDERGADVRRYHWPGDRAENIAASTEAALTLLVERAEHLVGSAAGSDTTAS
jgi:PncC family amidohydrolase